ncbi:MULTISPECIES: hypothetical protein [Paenibacillus]|uniref:hypothetical protein n=1 Tax=Paenibacillus TaxID=44249 RepID=UPI00096FE277|nr:hypothetical protein [Paenibacillus odorifer]OME27165.1 hypothetical protein BSK57_05485 [Paenibacillus odorifer]
MGQRKSILEMQWQITEGGKVVPFEEYLKGSVMDGISKHIFYDDLLATLEAGTDPDTQWTDVVDYIAPIACYILIEAVETDRELYNELVTSLKEAYVRLRTISNLARDAEEAAERENVLDRQQTPEFFWKFDELIRDLASGDRVIKAFDNQQDGCYKVVVGVGK